MREEDKKKFIEDLEKLVAKSKKIKESTIERTFCRYARSKNCYSWKLVFFHRGGFPDRTILTPQGDVFFIEFKSEKGKLTELQKEVRAQILGNKGRYYVCNKIGQAEKILDKYLLKGT